MSILTLRRKLALDSVVDASDWSALDEADESFLSAVSSAMSIPVSTLPMTTSSAFTNTRLTGLGAKSMTFLTSCSVRRLTGKPPTSLNSLPTLSVVATCVSRVTVLTRIAPVRLRLSVKPGVVRPPHMISTVRGAEASGSEASDEDVDEHESDLCSVRRLRRLLLVVLLVEARTGEEEDEDVLLVSSMECCGLLRLIVSVLTGSVLLRSG